MTPPPVPPAPPSARRPASDAQLTLKEATALQLAALAALENVSADLARTTAEQLAVASIKLGIAITQLARVTLGAPADAYRPKRPNAKARAKALTPAPARKPPNARTDRAPAPARTRPVRGR